MSGIIRSLIPVQSFLFTIDQITTAWALKKVFPEIELHIVPDAGHSSREPGTEKLLLEVCRPLALVSEW